MRYRLTIKTVSPLCISVRHPVVGLATPSMDYIPGTALRGALAMELLHRGESDTSPFFNSLFKDSTGVWGNPYPLNRIESDGPRRSLPLPLSALSCKRYPGFKNDLNGHGVRDSLIIRLTGDGERLPRCGQHECSMLLDDFRGFYVVDTDQYLEVSAGRRLIARTAITERCGTARSGSLYTLEALNEDQYFSGYLDLPDQYDADIRKLLLSGALFHIGAARRRGLGEVKVVNCHPVTGEFPELDQAVEDRLEDLNGKLHFQDQRLRFALTLYSDAIVLDDYQCYQTVITPEALRCEARFWSEIAHWPADLRLECTTPAEKFVYTPAGLRARTRWGSSAPRMLG
jgi:CRISPR-associated protein Csx10